MNKNRIGGLRWRASGHRTAKPISIKPTGGKSGGGASKAVELTLGDLRHVTESGLRVKRFILTVAQKAAEGKVGQAVGKAMEALQCRKAEQQARPSRERCSKARTVPRQGSKGKGK
jgi:hypothetical protein